jgi:cytochrome c biogenesis protein CcdA
MILSTDILLPQNLTAASILGFGFLLGLRHSIEADHLAAVSAIVSERKSVFRASIVGGVWGIGHTISLFLVGALVILLKFEISESWEKPLEFLVASMLVILGVNALRKIRESEEKQAETPEKSNMKKFGARSLIVGMIHGLAGSAALTLVVASAISPPLLALVFIIIFGIGSIGGMILASFLFSLPLHFTARKFAVVNRIFRVAAGIFSLALGVFIFYEIF